MAASEELTDIVVSTPPVRWSRWRWPLVVPVFFAGWSFYIWVPTIVDWIGLVWAVHTLGGFIPVYLTAKVAPSRQLPIAIECALLVGAWAIGLSVLIVFYWRDGTDYEGAVLAYVLGYQLVALGGAAWAVWLVKRKRSADPERGSTWARATGIMLPVFGLIAMTTIALLA